MRVFPKFSTEKTAFDQPLNKGDVASGRILAASF